MPYIKIILHTKLTDVFEIKKDMAKPLDDLQENGFNIEETHITQKKEE